MYLIIGSAQASGTERNPLDFSLRKRIIEKSFTPDVLKRITILGLNDYKGETNNSSSWGDYLFNFLVSENIIDSPDSRVVYITGDEDKVASWFDESTIKYFEFIKFERDDISSTAVRKHIIDSNHETVKRMLNHKIIADCELYNDIYSTITKTNR